MKTIRIPISDSLTNEHAVFCNIFDEIENLLPDVRTIGEVRLLSRLVEGVLSRHADVEQNLAFAALDHALEEKGQLKRLHQEHEEIDSCLRNAAMAKDLSKAVRLLKAGLKTSRAHFRHEERGVFPLFEKLFTPESLETLAAANSNGDSPMGQPGFGIPLSAQMQAARS